MGFIVDLAVVSVLWIGATMLIGVIPTIHRHNTTKNLKQTSKDVHTLLTPNETIVHIARQGNISGWNDTVVATDNRIIIHRIKWRWWGKAVFEDVAWEDVQIATTSKVSGFGLAHFQLLTTDGRKFMVGNLVKAQAQALLAICNDRRRGACTVRTAAPKAMRAPSSAGNVANLCLMQNKKRPTTHQSVVPNLRGHPIHAKGVTRPGMSTKIQQMKAVDEDAPSSPPPSKTEGAEKRGDEPEGDAEKNQKKADCRKESNEKSQESSKPSEEVTTKQAVGCIVAILAGIAVLVWLFSSCQAARESDIEGPPAEVTVGKLLADYKQNEDKANRLYLGRTIRIRGTVGFLVHVRGDRDFRMIHSTERRTNESGVVVISKGSIYGVQCIFDSRDAESFQALEYGGPVVVRGVIDSYTRGDVVVTDCRRS